MHKWTWTAAIALGATCALVAQDRLKTMPAHQQYENVAAHIPTAIKSGALAAAWSDDSRAVEFTRDGKRYRCEIASRQTTEATGGAETPTAGRGRGAAGAQPERGRQFDSATSPDGAWKAIYKDRNLFLSRTDGGDPVPITTDGSAEARIKYGTASWVYGEELNQRTAMWWSPDSRRLAYYRFDESRVPDYFITLNQTKLQSTVDTEAFPVAGV